MNYNIGINKNDHGYYEMKRAAQTDKNCYSDRHSLEMHLHHEEKTIAEEKTKTITTHITH